MASSLPYGLDIAPLLAVLIQAGEIFKRPKSDTDAEVVGVAKNVAGDVVNDRDNDLQRFLVSRFRELNPDHTYVGEEDIGTACATSFPIPFPSGQTICAIDPIDGSNNWSKGSKDCAITVGWCHEQQLVLGIVYFPFSGEFIVGRPGLEVTIKEVPLPSLKPYDPNNIRVAYGVGKLRTAEEVAAFKEHLAGVAQNLVRPGCASVSTKRVLCGECDAMISLKEVLTNVLPIFAIVKQLQAEGRDLYVSADLNNPEKYANRPFALAITTGEFARKHLKTGSPLAGWLEV